MSNDKAIADRVYQGIREASGNITSLEVKRKSLQGTQDEKELILVETHLRLEKSWKQMLMDIVNA